MFLNFKLLEFFPNRFWLIALGVFLSCPQLPLTAQSIPTISVCDTTDTSPQIQVQKNLNKAENSIELKTKEAGIWWIKEQLDKVDENLLISWQADSKNQHLDLIVDRQQWSRLDYLERYRFVHQFGTVARENYYSLRIFNQQQKCLVAYWCNFQMSPYQCQIKFESPNESHFQIYTPAPGEFRLETSQTERSPLK